MTSDHDDWPAGPPHDFSPKPRGASDRVCRVCGSGFDRAIHDAAYWKKRGIELVAPSEYLEWIADKHRYPQQETT